MSTWDAHYSADTAEKEKREETEGSRGQPARSIPTYDLPRPPPSATPSSAKQEFCVVTERDPLAFRLTVEIGDSF